MIITSYKNNNIYYFIGNRYKSVLLAPEKRLWRRGGATSRSKYMCHVLTKVESYSLRSVTPQFLAVYISTKIIQCLSMKWRIQEIGSIIGSAIFETLYRCGDGKHGPVHPNINYLLSFTRRKQ